MGFGKLTHTRQKEDALWATCFDQLRQHLGDEAFRHLTVAQRKSRWIHFDSLNRARELRKKFLARLAKEKLPAEERTNGSSSKDSDSDSDWSSWSEDGGAYRWNPYHSRSQPVRKSAIEEATKPKGTKNRKAYEPKNLPSDLMEYYHMCKNPDVSDGVRKAKMAEVNPVFQALHRQCLDEMKPQRREKYLRRLKAAIEGDFDKVWEEDSSNSESDSESDSVLPPKKKPAAAREQNRKRKTTDNGQEPAEELSTKKPAAKKPRVARGTGTGTGIAHAKSNPDRLLSPPLTGSSRFVSPSEQKLRELDPNQPITGTSTSAGLATIAEEPAVAPKKRGRPLKKSAVTNAAAAAAAAVAATSGANADANDAMADTEAPAPKKRSRSRKVPVAD